MLSQEGDRWSVKFDVWDLEAFRYYLFVDGLRL